MWVTPFRDDVAIVRGCRSVVHDGCLAEDMLNTHGKYPGCEEQLRVLRLPGSRLFVQRLEITDPKFLKSMCVRDPLWSERWRVMVYALARECLHGCTRLSQLCQVVVQTWSPASKQVNTSQSRAPNQPNTTQMLSPIINHCSFLEQVKPSHMMRSQIMDPCSAPKRANPSHMWSPLHSWGSPTNTLRNMMANTHTSSREIHFKNLPRRPSKTARQEARRQKLQVNGVDMNNPIEFEVRRRRPKRTGKCIHLCLH